MSLSKGCHFPRGVISQGVSLSKGCHFLRGVIFQGVSFTRGGGPTFKTLSKSPSRQSLVREFPKQPRLGATSVINQDSSGKLSFLKHVIAA